MKILRTATGEQYSVPVFQRDDGSCFWIGDFDIDADGGSNPDHDPYWQPETTLQHNGKSIDAEIVCGVVVPGWLPEAVGPIVLGCLAKVTNLATMQWSWAVVHDLGPLRKVGEGTPALAEAIGLNRNANTGGTDWPIVLVEVWPGRHATLDGVEYQLQPFRG